MQSLKYADLVNAMKITEEPVIVVVTAFIGELKEIGERLANDAGITPYYPRLSFGPSAEKLERKRRELIRKGGKPVMFIKDYPLAVHWEKGFKGFALTDAAQEAAVAAVQAQNEYIRAAPNKEERDRRCNEMMEKSMKPLNSFIKASKEELLDIERKAAELEVSGTEQQQQAFLEGLKKESFMQRVSRRIFGSKM